jgi:hypothetical protein
MRASKTALMTGAALACAAVAGLAAAAIANDHVMTLRLPDGSVAKIHYLGDTPPQVSLQPAPAAAPVGVIAFAPGFGANAVFADPAFADLARMEQAMDQQAAAMMRQAMAPGAAFAGPGGFTQVEMGRMPAGAHFCSRSVQIRDTGDGKAPQVITQSSGDCGAPAAASPGVSAPRPAAPVMSPQPGGLVQTRFAPATAANPRIGI